jgi:hypothetical protein
MPEWWSTEVFHGEFRARQGQDAHSSVLTGPAVTAGATGWEWHEHRWGAVFEVEPGGDSRWETFRAIPAVQAALDAVPDPVKLLPVPQGGGASPRRPQPAAGAGAMARSRPDAEERAGLAAATPAGLPRPAGHIP